MRSVASKTRWSISSEVTNQDDNDSILMSDTESLDDEDIVIRLSDRIAVDKDHQRKVRALIKGQLPAQDPRGQIDVLIRVIHSIPPDQLIDSDDFSFKIHREAFKKRKRPVASCLSKSYLHEYKNKVLDILADRNVTPLVKTVALYEVLNNCLCLVESQTLLKELVMVLNRNGVGADYPTVDKMRLEREKKINTFKFSPWFLKVADFMIQPPVSRAVPGKTVSMAYGHRAQKYIKNFTNLEAFNLFVKKHPFFPYKLSTFTTAVPRNVVPATVNDSVQNVCTIHSNVRRSIRAYNIWSARRKLSCLPSSTFQLVHLTICEQAGDMSDPANWGLECCEGDCPDCGVGRWVEGLTNAHRNRLAENIKFSSWKAVLDPADGKKKKILVTETVKLREFLDLLKSFMTEFALHIKTMFAQWEVCKQPLEKNTEEEGGLVVRVREDFQEDMQVLLREETVSTHRGTGKITVNLFPVALEVFDPETGIKDLHARP